MTSADLLPAAVLKRKAVVYVRQSTLAQVQSNLEGQRRQYELVEEARGASVDGAKAPAASLVREGARDVRLSGAGRAFDKKHAGGGIGILAACLCHDGSDRIASLGLDFGDVQALFIRRARKRSHGAKDSVEFMAFESLET